MLNYQECMNKNIGRRIRNLRDSIGLKPAELAGQIEDTEHITFTKQMLTTIEAGKPFGKCATLLSEDRICACCHSLGLEPLDLIWGTENERESYAKMVLLALMSNGDIDYKTGEEFNPFLEHEWRKEDYPIEERYPYSNTFDDREAFFHNKDNYDSYEVLKNGYDKSYDKISSLICKRLGGFIDANYPQYIDDFIHLGIDPDSPDYDSEFEKLLKIKEVKAKDFQFLADRMHYKELGYYHFTNEIFPAFWDSYKKIYMDFFNEYIFEIKSDFIKDGIRYYRNEYFNQHFLSPRFIEINRNDSDQFYADRIDEISPEIKKKRKYSHSKNNS